MLEVVSLEEARSIVAKRFAEYAVSFESVSHTQAAGRILAQNIVAEEGVPPFDRSTVDGFAVCAADTFGCSDALPALLNLTGEVEMGEEVNVSCAPGTCIRIPTGGKVPAGADAVVMLEYCEEYGDGTIGVAKPAAPGDGIVFENDDIAPGSVLIEASTRLQAHHVGTLASLGLTTCNVLARMKVGIVSTGDEIVEVAATPVASQMRDVNTPLLASAVEACGGDAACFPIVPDDYDALLDTAREALNACDMVLVSGGSSAGQKDNTARVLEELGELLFHGIAVKPGKPTMCANCAGKPVFGLPGHPAAAYFMFLELAAPLLDPAQAHTAPVHATLTQGLPSNHGRTELVPVRLKLAEGGLQADPIRSKSGLISQLCTADGYLEIDRNTEGLAAGSTVRVRPFTS